MGSGRSTAFTGILLLSLFLLRLPGLMDNTASGEKKKTILEHADLIEGGESSSLSGKPQPYRSSTGNVRFRQEKVVLEADHAIEYPESNRIELVGNIMIRNDALEVYGDTGVYYPDEEAGELIGNARGRIIRDNLVARSNKSVFNMKTDELWLYDDAIAWHHERQLSGDVIRVHAREVQGKKSVDEIQVHGHALFAARDTLSTGRPLFDQLAGERMVIAMNERSKLTSVTVTSKARSLYHSYDDNRPSGVNFTSGDLIRMFFNEGKLSRIVVTNNALGKQYPDHMREDPAIDLQGFRWRESEKPVFR